jgi:hypothetical protein
MRWPIQKNLKSKCPKKSRTIEQMTAHIAPRLRDNATVDPCKEKRGLVLAALGL